MTATTPVEHKISKRIRDFDIVSLLHVLNQAGYQNEDIQFRSHPSLCSQESLIQDIEFRNKPEHLAVISLNMGLLGPQSPIPSYFQKMIDTGRMDALSFYQFIGYFDHFLLWNYIQSVYPESNYYRSPTAVVQRMGTLKSIPLTSPSTLHSLLRMVVPELGVHVEKAVMQHDVKTISLRLGKAVIGSDATFGEKKRVPVHGMRIVFYSEEETTALGDPWSKEIQKRFRELLLPILGGLGLQVEMLLIIRTQASYAKLHSQSYLGYDKIRGGEEKMRSIRLFRGRI